jgi:hypothetical protein
MQKKAPTAINGRGAESFGLHFRALTIAPSYQAQHLTHHFVLSPFLAETLAPMIYGSAHHG